MVAEHEPGDCTGCTQAWRIANGYGADVSDVQMNEPSEYKILAPDNFSAQLFRLIAKADTLNRERIRRVFPAHVEAFEDWYYQRGFYAPKGDEIAP